MSYILNALKRSEQERQASKAPAMPVRLATTAGAGTARPRLRGAWIAAGAGAVLVVAAGAWAVLDRAGEGEVGDRTAAVDAPVAAVVADVPPEPAVPPAEADGPVPPVKAAAPSVAVAAVAEPAPPPVAVVQPLPDRDRPEAASRLLAARLTAGTAPSPGEPAAILDTPERATPQESARVPVPSLPLANMVPPPPARAPAKAPPATDAPAPEPVTAVAEETAQPAPEAVAAVEEESVEPPAPAPAAAPAEEPVALAALTGTDWEDPSEKGPLPPVTTDAEAIRKAAQFNELGWTYERDGSYGSAIEAFSRALAVRPDFADAYFGRAWVNERLDRLDDAIADYGWAIRLKPDFAAAHNSRGIALLYRGHYAEAARHFARAFDLGDGEMQRYAALWRFIAFERAGEDARAQLRADARAMGVDRWPGVLARYYLGEADTDAVLAEAETSDPITRRERLCVAHFFLGQQALLRGDQSRAQSDFRAVLETGVSAFAQYAAAERELTRLAALDD